MIASLRVLAVALALAGCGEVPRCEAHTDCPVGSLCTVATGVCDSPCVASACAGGLACDLAQNTCLTRCGTSEDCSAGHACDPVTGECLLDDRCVTDADCAAGFACDSLLGECRTRCATNDDCAVGYACTYETGACERVEAP